ncbi:sterol carrier family protein [Lipingzhangella sp. LS1_29]|uniref:Sterol carrier family protein n=1 Tax=Lipingzhangella rawalii TaxID=2055835 RepID=A0ABU2H996_9ACTN|nr:sterol carrier family protein [Lipingzhangella rawalii]MDS1271889.1 sterol carrier family protein [Lipingzhangella rawalii]
MARQNSAAARRAQLRTVLNQQLAELHRPAYAGPDSESALVCAAVRTAVDALASGHTPERGLLRAAVRGSLAELGRRAPGSTLEVRVPPFGAAQCLEGPRHTRGTPPSVVETTPQVWLRLCSGDLDWHHAVAAREVAASGAHTDLGRVLPLYPVQPGN